MSGFFSGCKKNVCLFICKGLPKGCRNRWGDVLRIDFDYEVNRIDYDVLCLGNVLLQVVGKGRHSLHDIRLQSLNYPDFSSPLTLGDMSLMFQYRVANLGKLYPHISEDLNQLLMRFSVAIADPYNTADSLLADLLLLFPPQNLIIELQ